MKNFFGVPPSPQNALDLFEGSWSSRLPPGEGREGLRAGQAYLYGDLRLEWCFHETGGVEGQRVLEIGPLEASHTWMLESRGAAAVTAVEANGNAFLRCLVMKELLGIRRARFLLGDAVRYLETCDETYDFGLACGVLYHLTEPLRFLRLMLERCDRILLWTHVYDPAWADTHPQVARKFGPGVEREEAGFRCNHVLYAYNEALNWSGFCGGGQDHAYWLSRADVLRAVEAFGGEVLALQDEDHPHGAALWLVVRRRR